MMMMTRRSRTGRLGLESRAGFVYVLYFDTVRFASVFKEPYKYGVLVGDCALPDSDAAVM